MKNRIALFFAVLGLLAGAARAADSLTMADFVYTNKLQIAGYTGTETLANFPVLVRISTSLGDFEYSRMRSTKGGDLAFFAADGTKLASEVDTWGTSGTSLVWVKLPSMAQGTQFYMCYRLTEEQNALGTMVENPNPWGDYVGVWHLSETGTKPEIADSTENGLNGNALASNGEGLAAGRIGRARRIAKGREHAYGIVVGASSGAQKAVADSLGTDFSASFWMNPQGATTYSFLIDRRKGEAGTSWGLRLHSGTKLQVYAADERPFWETTGDKYDGTRTENAFSGLYANNTWSKVDIHWYATGETTGAADIYVNGLLVETVALPNVPAQADANIGIGGSTADTPGNTTAGKGRQFNGHMDEVRLRPGVVSADWVKADYDTVNNESFVIVAPPEEFSVAWANASGDTPGVSATTHDTVTFGGTVRNLGETAASCAIEAKVWAVGASEPAAWTTLANGLVVDDAFAVAVPGLSKDTEYNYVLRAVGNDGIETNAVSGAFRTLAGLTIAWSSASGTSGFSKISQTYATVGGTVSLLGGATGCEIQYKVWETGGSEPSSWTTLAQGLALNESFSETISGRAPGTSYSYKLRAVGDDGEETDVVAGSFTTPGNAADTVGSPYTHFFDDGTNACWVVNDFERFLPFTVTGYTGTETLTNFPVLVDIRRSDTNGFSYDDFYHYDGKDMAFVDELGHIIPHEIDTWNKNGMSLIWVRLPEMNNGTTFTMCYRSPLVDPLPPPENTFERYVGVWHMNETQNGVVWLRDSTTNNLPGETHAQSLAGPNVGQMIGGNARRVAQQPGTSANYGRIIVFDHDDILRTGVGNVFTYSGWYKLTETPPKWSYLVGRKANDQDRGWGIQYEENSTTELRVWSGSTEKGKFQKFATPGAEATGWNYWTFVFDGGVNGDGTTNRLFHAYLNGRELASTAGGFALNYDIANDETADYDNLCIGGQQTGTGAFNGWVDEARFSKGVRSPDWIKAEYDSMRQKDAPFVTKGAQVSNGAESLVPVVVWERGNNLPDTILDLSYAYVQFAGTVTFCGAGATECRVEYQIWPEGESRPAAWTVLKDRLVAYDYFAIPVTGLKQDMAYNFRIRAVNVVDGQERQNREHEGTFRTHGNVNVENVDGELYRLDDKFVHLYRAGSYIFTAPDYATNVEILVVGGGGGGG
ncbi:MAG: DUF2341 domain-containing protein, partial [Kiritimatiellae bacterium]|nr:DUF2341 domain-containing protein [Kiritimatiellia bacterium]